jgi:hypothetical protein
MAALGVMGGRALGVRTIGVMFGGEGAAGGVAIRAARNANRLDTIERSPITERREN